MRLMNSTPAEFARALRLAFGDALGEDATGLTLKTDCASLHFSLISENSRKIGALQINSLRVEISVQEGNEAAVGALLARVDRATFRGGG